MYKNKFINTTASKIARAPGKPIEFILDQKHYCWDLQDLVDTISYQDPVEETMVFLDAGYSEKDLESFYSTLITKTISFQDQEVKIDLPKPVNIRLRIKSRIS